MRGSLVVVGSLSLFAFGCGSAPAGTENGVSANEDLSADTATTYVDIGDYWKTSADQTAWSAAVANVKLQFENICGDTYCDGDYENFDALQLECAVSSIRGAVKSCTWVFAASNVSVDGAKGTITASTPRYLCAFNPTGNAAQLAKAFGATGSLQQPIPGLTQSLYDVVGNCFHPETGSAVAANAVAEAAPAAPTYEDASDADGVDQGAWYDMTGALGNSFNNVCGDTFCEGDFGNLESFQFACSVGTKSLKIHECRWIFAGSYALVDAKKGTINVTAKSFVCTIPTHGTVQQLMTTLGAAGSVEPIDRALPGETTSAYDAIAKCLP